MSKVFYTHISYSAQVKLLDNSKGTLNGEMLASIINWSIEDLREIIAKNIEKDQNVKVLGKPTITCISVLPEKLYKILHTNK